MTNTISQRQSKYCRDIEVLLSRLGHATNSRLLFELRKTYPSLSATTVHRATARLAARDVIAIAPTHIDGSMQYDAYISPHDHFQCSVCGMLRDADIKNEVVTILESSISDCHVSGRLTISGVCKKCKGARI